MKRSAGFIRGAMVLAAGVWVLGLTAGAANAQDAKQLYEKNCNNCHGANGKGDGPAAKMLKPPPADFGAVLKGKADADVAKIIKVGGKAIGKSALMPPFGTKLSDEQIQSIVEYVKGLGAK